MPVIRIVIMGDSDVGKTSLINKYVDNIFSEEKPSNASKEENKHKKITIKKEEIILELIDLVSSINATVSDFYRADACIALLDINNPQSKENVRNFLGIATRFVTSDNFVKCICVNKIDLENKISDDEINELISQCNVTKSFKISTKTGEGVEEMFKFVAETVMNETKPVQVETPTKKCVLL